MFCIRTFCLTLMSQAKGSDTKHDTVSCFVSEPFVWLLGGKGCHVLYQNLCLTVLMAHHLCVHWTITRAAFWKKDHCLAESFCETEGLLKSRLIPTTQEHLLCPLLDGIPLEQLKNLWDCSQGTSMCPLDNHKSSLLKERPLLGGVLLRDWRSS